MAIYIRWSTDDQASGTTLEVQREGCELYIRSQGWRVRPDLVFLDDGYTGAHLQRPGMIRLRERVAAGEIDCVVVLKIDRLSRNIVDAVELVLREWEGRCHLKSVREPIDTTQELGRMIFGLLAMFADFERATIRERTQSGKIRRIAQGQQLHAEPAYGYRRDPLARGRWIEEENEAVLVRRMFQMAGNGTSASGICRQFNREGIRTRAGKEWCLRSVLWVLHNRIYIGEVIYGRTSLRPARDAGQAGAGGARGAAGTLANWGPRRRLVRVVNDLPAVQGKTAAAPPLVTPEIFQAAQQQLEARRCSRRAMGSRGLTSPHLLVGIARCPCGAALVHKVQTGQRSRGHGGTYRHYICARSRTGLCTSNGHIPGELAERLVEEYFLALYSLRSFPVDRFLPHLEAAAAEGAAVAAALAQTRVQLDRLRTDELRLLRAVRAGEVPLADLQPLRQSAAADRADLSARLRTLEESLARLKAGAGSLHSTLANLQPAEGWSLLAPGEKRQLLRMVLADRIVITKARGENRLNVHITWAY